MEPLVCQTQSVAVKQIKGALVEVQVSVHPGLLEQVQRRYPVHYVETSGFFDI